MFLDVYCYDEIYAYHDCREGRGSCRIGNLMLLFD